MLWFLVSVGGVFLIYIILRFVKTRYNIKQPWKFELISEFIIYVASAAPVFVAFYFPSGNIFRGLAAASVFYVLFLLRLLYAYFVQHKPEKSKLYRLPLVKCEGVISEKHIYVQSSYPMFCEWIVLVIANDQQIKVYVTEFGYEERSHLPTFNIGDTGTLHYRKGKKYSYFERFEPKLDD